MWIKNIIGPQKSTTQNDNSLKYLQKKLYFSTQRVNDFCDFLNIYFLFYVISG